MAHWFHPGNNDVESHQWLWMYRLDLASLRRGGNVWTQMNIFLDRHRRSTSKNIFPENTFPDMGKRRCNLRQKSSVDVISGKNQHDEEHNMLRKHIVLQAAKHGVTKYQRSCQQWPKTPVAHKIWRLERRPHLNTAIHNAQHTCLLQHHATWVHAWSLLLFVADLLSGFYSWCSRCNLKHWHFCKVCCQAYLKERVNFITLMVH